MTPAEDRLRQATELVRAAQWARAGELLRTILSRDPRHAIANGLMALVMSKQADPERAVFFLERALASDPANPDLLHNLANARLALGDARAAEETYARVVAARPDHIPSSIGLSALLCAAGSVDQAEALCLRALRHSPDCVPLLCNLAGALRMQGRLDEAVALLRRAETLDPSDAQTVSTLAQTLTYAPGIDPAEVFAVHSRYGALVEQRAAQLPRHDGTRDPDRPLRIGLVSADLRAHSVASFIEPWLEHRDRAGFGVVCFSASPRLAEDQASARLRSLADGWRRLPANLSFADTAAMIRADRIDILVDLSGHTAGNRLPVFALRPAPVQVTYLGYPHTTGMRSIDYRIVDSTTDPAASDRFASERLCRIDPCFLCYQPPSVAPPVAPRPPQPGVTFCSFNALAKLSEPTVRLWAAVLAATPGSRLLLKNDVLGCDQVRRQVHSRFANAGIDQSRLDLLPRSPTTAEHLACYARADIALDPTPYNGATTTCEALFMGVPVVSLAGNSHAGRVGASLLAAAGLADLIAQDEPEYVRLAASLAADAPRLADLRGGLRNRLTASALCNGSGFARRFEAALRGVWRDHCLRQVTGPSRPPGSPSR